MEFFFFNVYSVYYNITCSCQYVAWYVSSTHVVIWDLVYWRYWGFIGDNGMTLRLIKNSAASGFIGCLELTLSLPIIKYRQSIKHWRFPFLIICISTLNYVSWTCVIWNFLKSNLFDKWSLTCWEHIHRDLVPVVHPTCWLISQHEIYTWLHYLLNGRQ